MLSIHLKWDFLRRRPEECNSSKKANQNRDSICGSTPNLKEAAGRLLQQNRHMAAPLSGCSERVRYRRVSRRAEEVLTSLHHWTEMRCSIGQVRHRRSDMLAWSR